MYSTHLTCRTSLLIAISFLSGCAALMEDRNDPSGGASAPLCQPDTARQQAALESSICTGEWLYSTKHVTKQTRCVVPATCPEEVLETLRVSTQKDLGRLDRPEARDRDPIGGPSIRTFLPDERAAETACKSFEKAEVAGKKEEIAPDEFDSQVIGSHVVRWRNVGGRHYATCRVTVKYPRVGRPAPCRCVNQDEEVTTIESGLLSQPNLTEARLRAEVEKRTSSARTSITSLECLTCDPQETITPGARFACLSSNLGKGSAETDEKIRDRQQVIYELYGHTLSAGERGAAQATYDTLAPQFASCTTLEAPACLRSGAASPLANECGRLTGGHVSPELVAGRIEACLELLATVPDLNQCPDLESSVGQARTVAETLALAAIDFSKAGEDEHRAAVRRTHYLAIWWKLAEKLSRYETDGTARALDSQEAVLERYWSKFSDSVSLEALQTLAKDDATTTEELRAAMEQLVSESSGTRGALNALISTPTEGAYPLDTRPASGAPGLEGDLLLLVLADALRNEVERADTLSGAHDLICLFADCKRQQPATAMVKFWWTLANLEQAAQASDRFTAGELAGLTSVLDAVRRGSLHERLTQALAGRDDVAHGRIALQGLIALGEARNASFVNHGLFLGSSNRHLQDVLDAKGAMRSADEVRIAAERFAAAQGQYDANVRAVLAALTTDVVGGLNYEVTMARRNVLAKAHEQLEARAASRRAAATRAALTADDVAGDFEAIAKLFGKTYTSRVGPLAHVEKFTRNNSDLNSEHDGYDASSKTVAALAIWKRENFGPNELVRVIPESGGVYSPTCALSTIKSYQLDTPDSGFVGGLVDAVVDEPPAALNDTLFQGATGHCGPEGWSVTYSEGKAEATAANYSVDTSARGYVGAKFEVCATAQGPAYTAAGCLYGGVELSQTTAASNSQNTSAHSTKTASVADGLRSSKAPFGFAPLGALLLVVAKDGVILDVAVAHSGGISQAVPEGANAYLIVNDTYCAASPSDQTMSATVGIYTTEEAAAQVTRDAITEVTKRLRTSGEQHIADKSFSPTQQAALQADATLALSSQLAAANINSDDTTAKMGELFNKYVANEIARISVLVDAALFDDEASLKALEIVAIDNELRASRAQNRLNALLPLWAVRDIGTTKLQTQMNILLSQVRERFMPLVRIWYPEYVETMERKLNDPTGAESPMRDLLVRLTPEADLGAVAADIKSAVVDDLFENFDAARRASATGQETNVVAVSIPNPEHEDFAATWKSRWNYPTVDRATALDIWQQIKDGKSGTITIQPDLVYGDTTVMGLGYLDCRDITPVVRKMMIAVARPYSSDLGSRNALGRTTHVTFGGENWFATDAGLDRYTLDEDGWYKMNIAVMDATDGPRDASASNPIVELSKLVERGAARRDIGVSPFGDITIDFRDWMDVDAWLSLPSDTFGPSNGAPTWLASELVIVMEVDTQRSENREGLTWVSTCPDFGVN